MKPGDAASAFIRRAAAVLVLALAGLRAQPAPPAAPLIPPASDSPAASDGAAEQLRFHFVLQSPPGTDVVAAPAEPAEAASPAGVLRLPKFEVRDRYIDLAEHEILTEKGLVDYAKQHYLTPVYQKTFGQLSQLALLYFNPLALLGGWHPNDAEAMALYEQEARLRRIRRTEDLLDLYRVDDAKDAIELRGMLYNTYRHDEPPPTRGHHDQ